MRVESQDLLGSLTTGRDREQLVRAGGITGGTARHSVTWRTEQLVRAGGITADRQPDREQLVRAGGITGDRMSFARIAERSSSCVRVESQVREPKPRGRFT